LEQLERDNQNEDRTDLYAEHPFEVYLEEGDIRKLVMMSCILADTEVLVLDRPVLARFKSRKGIPTLEFDCWKNEQHVWQRPEGLKTNEPHHRTKSRFSKGSTWTQYAHIASCWSPIFGLGTGTAVVWP
jgi:hypothetical protein